MIILPIKKQWFDMILAGEKLEEYREIKSYWDTRLCNEFGMFWINGELICGKIVGLTEIGGDRERNIMFRNGYSKNSPSIIANCTLSVGTGREEWGAEPGKQYFILKIHDILEKRNVA